MKRSKTIDSFTKALEIITTVQQKPEEFDLILFLLRLATKNPSVLVSVYQELNSSLRNRVIEECRLGRKIQAIKIYREDARVGLKEAKEAVEKIIGEEGIPGYNSDGTFI